MWTDFIAVELLVLHAWVAKPRIWLAKPAVASFRVKKWKGALPLSFGLKSGKARPPGLCVYVTETQSPQPLPRNRRGPYSKAVAFPRNRNLSPVYHANNNVVMGRRWRHAHQPTTGEPPAVLDQVTTRYDTIRYGRLTCAQKLTSSWPA